MSRIQAVIFDWAGTVVDYGCFAPMNAFMQAFEQAGVPISEDEVRGPMGKLKRDHIQSILQIERVRLAWRNQFDSEPVEADIDRLYASFEERLMATLHRFTDPLPGVLEVVKELRGRGLKIGSTTGYTRKMMKVVTEGAKEKGYEPDYMIASDEVKQGRPYPYMIYKNLLALEVSTPKAAVKVGDTLADVLEGKRAGVWSVAVIQGSSELGLKLEEVERSPAGELEMRMEHVRRKFKEAGADYVIDTIDELPALLDMVERRGDRLSNEPIL